MFTNRMSFIGLLCLVLTAGPASAAEEASTAASLEPVLSPTVEAVEAKNSAVEKATLESAGETERVDCFYEQYRYHSYCATTAAK